MSISTRFGLASACPFPETVNPSMFGVGAIMPPVGSKNWAWAGPAAPSRASARAMAAIAGRAGSTTLGIIVVGIHFEAFSFGVAGSWRAATGAPDDRRG